jgi:hyperosmotically inducible periplasmic protein
LDYRRYVMNTSFGRLAPVLALLFASVVAGCATHDTSVGTKIDDSAITTQVKAALLADPDVSGQKVSVDTVNGVVQLSGFVPTQAAATRAVEIARGVSGVSNVQNKITVRNE